MSDSQDFFLTFQNVKREVPDEDRSVLSKHILDIDKTTTYCLFTDLWVSRCVFLAALKWNQNKRQNKCKVKKCQLGKFYFTFALWGDVELRSMISRFPQWSLPAGPRDGAPLLSGVSGGRCIPCCIQADEDTGVRLENTQC